MSAVIDLCSSDDDDGRNSSNSGGNRRSGGGYNGDKDNSGHNDNGRNNRDSDGDVRYNANNNDDSTRYSRYDIYNNDNTNIYNPYYTVERETFNYPMFPARQFFPINAVTFKYLINEDRNFIDVFDDFDDDINYYYGTSNTNNHSNYNDDDDDCIQIIEPPPQKKGKRDSQNHAENDDDDNEPIEISEQEPQEDKYEYAKLPRTKMPSGQDLQGEQCPICLEAPIENPVGTRKCTHFFCYDCIYNWLSRYNKFCPTCRQKITKSDLVVYIQTGEEKK